MHVHLLIEPVKDVKDSITVNAFCNGIIFYLVSSLSKTVHYVTEYVMKIV